MHAGNSCCTPLRKRSHPHRPAPLGGVTCFSMVSSTLATLNPWLCSNLRVVTEVARSLEFAPAIERMADRIVDKIAKSAHGFNAVHLRIEKDARDWSQIMGGPEVHKAVCIYA